MMSARFICMFFSLIAVLASTTWSFAGNESSGGGDKDGLSAAAALKLVPAKLKKLGSDLVSSEEMKKIDEIATSETTLIMMQDEKPNSVAAGMVQLGTAFSSTGKQFRVTAIYRKDWEDAKSDKALQIAFMTHEVCVLAGIENTGAYGRVSAEMLNRLRKDGGPDLPVIQKHALEEISWQAFQLQSALNAYPVLGPEPFRKDGLMNDCDVFKSFGEKMNRIEIASLSCSSLPNIVPLVQLLKKSLPKASAVDQYCSIRHPNAHDLLPLLMVIDEAYRPASNLYFAATDILNQNK